MKINPEKIVKISSLLERETYLYSRLHKIAGEIRDLIVGNNIDKLSKLVESEDTIFTQAEKLRQDRMDIMLDIKNDLNLTDEEYGLGRLMEFMSDNEAKEIQVLRDKLIDGINKLDSVNRSNHDLVNFSMDLNAKFMNLLVNLGQPNQVYHSSGKIKKQDNNKRRLLDRKI